MTNATRNALRRALDDLTQGVKALLGIRQSPPELVRELLEGPDEEPRGHQDIAARRRSRTSVRTARSDHRRAPRSKGPAENPLAPVR